MRTCNSCKHWDVFPVDMVKDFKRGTCQRFPPTQDLVAVLERKNLGLDDVIEDATDAVFWRQPTTFEDGICGEHDPVQSDTGEREDVVTLPLSALDQIAERSNAAGMVPFDPGNAEHVAALVDMACKVAQSPPAPEVGLPLHSPTQPPR